MLLQLSLPGTPLALAYIKAASLWQCLTDVSEHCSRGMGKGMLLPVMKCTVTPPPQLEGQSWQARGPRSAPARALRTRSCIRAQTWVHTLDVRLCPGPV